MLGKSLTRVYHRPRRPRHTLSPSLLERPDPLGLTGKVVIVTGAASGIGRSTTDLLAGLGAHVVAVDRDTVQLVELSHKPTAQGTVLNVEADLGTKDSEHKILTAALDGFGRLDAAVFAAGANSSGNVTDITSQTLHDSIAANVDVHLGISQEILRDFEKGRFPVRGCSLVYIVSKVAIAPTLGFGAYPISKAAQLHLARMVALEGASYGVRANCVNPGAVFEGSGFWAKELIADKAARHGVPPEELEEYYARRTMLGVRVTPRDVAHVAAFLASPLSRAITGAIVPVDGGLAATFSR